MKTSALFLMSMLLLCATAMSQEPVITKGQGSQDQRTEQNYELTEVETPISELYDGGSGYAQYFYYGDPTGMFLEEKWADGSVLLSDGSTLIGTFRYNLYMQKIQAAVAGDTFAFANPLELDFLMMGDRKFIYNSFSRSDYEVSDSWFEVLEEGKCDLLARRYIKYYVGTTDNDPSNEKMYKVKELYVRHEDGKIQRLLLSKDALKQALNDHEQEICDYMKAEKLKIKNQEELVKIFAYYNTLD